ncbi:MAG TPA: hypothetical protein VNF02_04085 [Candidatus Limnocylindrales bacterium]|nr:hypothetical protein [Candidatus Limnocylindrales bacterium]
MGNPYGTDVDRLRCDAFDYPEQLNKMRPDSTSKRAQTDWRMPVYGALAAALVFLPLLISSNTDVLYLFVIVPGLALMGICVLIYAAIRKKLPLAVTVAIFWAVSAVVLLYNFQIRTFTRWFLWSGQYEKEVLAEPTPANRDLKHIEWDGWGWGGQDFSVFLVFDPTDSLAGPAENNQSGKFNGIPFEVSSVRRMDSHWYLVFFDFYVGQSSWDNRSRR